MRNLTLICIVIIAGCGGLSERKIENVADDHTARLIAQLENGDCVEGKYNGVEKKLSKTFAIYDSLLKTASDSVWYKLTYDKSAVARCYAFQALFTKKSNGIDSIANRMEGDTDSICYKENIYQLNCTVGWFVKRILNQDSSVKKVIVK
jgi:hypothetical protein